MSKPIIEVKSLVKQFRNWETLPDRQLKKLLIKTLKFDFRKPEFTNITILDDVSFEIMPGEFVGIMGRNGIGKSTILKLLSGIYAPTSGKVVLRSKVAPLLELGAGFDTELTGFENIYLNASILGCSQKKIEQIIDPVIEFSGLKEKIHMPMKNYSSGMLVRLGFSIAVHTDFDILLLDEVLGVGDAAFFEKSNQKIRELHRNGKTILLVTHSPQTVLDFCERCIVIEDKKKVFDGDATGGIAKYNEILGVGGSA